MKITWILSGLREIFVGERSETYMLVSSGLAGFFLIFIVNAIVGLYSVFGMSSDLSENFSGINTARSAQLALHEQVISWNRILLSEGRYPDFKDNFLEFSRRGESVQNMLFNLKLQYPAERDIVDSLERLTAEHKKMTADFISRITYLQSSGFTKVRQDLKTTDDETMLVNTLDDIAGRIERLAERRDRGINRRYILFFSFISIVLVILLVRYGKLIGSRLLRTHDHLESTVAERTKDYLEANISLKREIEEHKVTEEKLVRSKREIEEKSALLTVSEKRYRHIVEGTKDVIFTLNDDWYFKTVNDAVKTGLRISPESITRYRLTDLICDQLTDAAMLRRIITEKLEVSRRENSPLKFNAQMKTPNLIEPVEFKISLEFVEIDGVREIIGKAEKTSDEMFTESFICEKSEYMIKNLLFEADDITHRITVNLQKYLDKNDINMIRIGLREIIINSIEHGNLNISFEEKTDAILSDRYFEFINERQSLSEYMGKRVRIEFMITPDRAIYKITDQGRGFNHRKYLAGVRDETDETGLAHGRGITMVKNIFDEVRYNSKGNQVLLVKNLGPVSGVSAEKTVAEAAGVKHAEVG